MRLNKIDLNLFVVFNTIYQERNLTRAAEVLCITQPAVSNALGRMRLALNDQLFISTPGAMVPTPVAENIHSRVSEALSLLNSSILEGDKFVPDQAEKVFRVSMNDFSESLLLPNLTKAIQKEAPAINIESAFSPRRDIAKELTAGSIDLAIDAPLIEDPQLHHQKLLSSPYVCMLSQDHPWSSSKLSLKDYLSLDHIHISSRRRGFGAVDTALNKLGEKRTVRSRVQHYMIAPLIAMQSTFALTGPYHLLRHYNARLLELPFDIPPLEIHMYWHRSSDLDQANRWFRSQVEASADDEHFFVPAQQNN